jgi:hypothetical protein
MTKVLHAELALEVGDYYEVDGRCYKLETNEPRQFVSSPVIGVPDVNLDVVCPRIPDFRWVASAGTVANVYDRAYTGEFSSLSFEYVLTDPTSSMANVGTFSLDTLANAQPNSFWGSPTLFTRVTLGGIAGVIVVANRPDNHLAICVLSNPGEVPRSFRKVQINGVYQDFLSIEHIAEKLK